jgi:hypothetical protein
MAARFPVRSKEFDSLVSAFALVLKSAAYPWQK